MKSILSFGTNNAFKNYLIVKQKKLYGYKVVALGPKIFHSQISNFKMFSNDILSGRIVTKAVTEKNGSNFEFEFQIFVSRKV